MKKILAIDDHEDILLLLKAVLAGRYEFIPISKLEYGIDEIAKHHPDLVILDIDMPDRNGFELCNDIRNHTKIKHIPIVMLTAKKDMNASVMAYKLGADDFISKPFENEHLLAVIESKLKRFFETRQEELVFFLGNLHININKNQAKVNDKFLELTLKEFQILAYMAKHKSSIISRESLISHVWGHDAKVSDRAVDNHVTNIRRKLRPSNISINAEYGKGYKIQVVGEG